MYNIYLILVKIWAATATSTDNGYYFNALLSDLATYLQLMNY